MTNLVKNTSLATVKGKGSISLENSLTGLVDIIALNQLTGGYNRKQINQSDTLLSSLRYYLVSNNRILLSHAYAEIGIVQTLIDQPVEDAYRNQIIIKSEQLDEKDIKELNSYLERENVLNTLIQARKWARLFGGGGIIVNCGQKADEELNINAINEKTPLEFYDADLWELNDSTTNFQSQMVKSTNDIPYNYYGVRLHKSRVFRVMGKKAPALVRPKLRGWGMSEVERLVRSINQYLKNQDLIFELLDEAKIDVFKISNYNSSLATREGTEIIARRVQAANTIKNYENALTMDVEDDYQQKQLTFAGLADILNEIRKGIAADLRMPMTKLFGISSSGFNAGDDDIENYNAMVESEIRSKDKYIIIDILQICCKKLFGFIPDDLQIEFEPLRILTHEQVETVKNHKQNRLINLYDRGLITPEECISGHNSENLTDSLTIDENKLVEQEETNRED